MQKNNAITELMAGYNTYAGAEDLNVSAISDTPATSAICIGVSATIIIITISVQ